MSSFATDLLYTHFNYNTTSTTTGTKSVHSTFTASVDTRYVRFDKGTIVQVPGITVTGDPQVCFGSEDYRVYGIAYDYVSTGTDCEEASSFPVEWLDFSVSLKNEHAQLKWSTASELNNEYFTIERSFDGIEFDELDFIPAAGTTNEVSNYSYEDFAVTDLRVARVYYRIRQTDTDGEFAYSNVLELTLPLQTPITVSAYPNPATSQTRIRIGAESATHAELRIINSMGREVYSQHVHVSEANEIIDLDIRNWAAGFYIIQLSDELRSSTFRLVVY